MLTHLVRMFSRKSLGALVRRDAVTSFRLRPHRTSIMMTKMRKKMKTWRRWEVLLVLKGVYQLIFLAQASKIMQMVA